MTEDDLADRRCLADFLDMLEIWEAAAEKSNEPMETAALIGWIGSDRKLTETARACHAACVLMQGGYLVREDLRDLRVKDVLEIVECAQVRMDQLDKISRRTKQPVEAAKQRIGEAAKVTARESREGKIAHRDLRGRVEVNAYQFAKEAKAEGKSPPFAVFGKRLVAQIARWNNTDVVRKKIDEMIKSLPLLETQEDMQIIDRVAFALELSNIRNAKSIKRLRAMMKQSPIPDDLLVRQFPL